MIFVLLAVIFLQFSLSHRRNNVKVTEYLTKIEYRHDTIRQFIPVPHMVYIDRVDTVYGTVVLKDDNIPGDTLTVPIELPIERKEYRTNDYFAVIEGFRPTLVQLDIYREIPVITNTEVREISKRPQFGIGLQAGYGFNGEKLFPYMGIGIQYNLFSW